MFIAEECATRRPATTRKTRFHTPPPKMHERNGSLMLTKFRTETIAVAFNTNSKLPTGLRLMLEQRLHFFVILLNYLARHPEKWERFDKIMDEYIQNDMEIEYLNRQIKK